DPKAKPHFRFDVREAVENLSVSVRYVCCREGGVTGAIRGGITTEGLASGVDLCDLRDCGGDGGEIEEHAGAEVHGGAEEGDSKEELGLEGGGDGEGDGRDGGLEREGGDLGVGAGF
ncbi:MAG: hypothetical protein Q9188_006535, partial [Gyalolechia gomerana]